MKRFLSVLTFITLLLTIASCGSDQKNQAQQDNDATIEALEEQLFSDSDARIDRKAANQLSYAYETKALELNDSIQTPELLMKAADLSMNLGNPRRAIGLFDQVIINYPKSDKAPTALFLKAFTYDDQLQDYTNAAKYYQDFLNAYPGSPFANDAEMSLKYLGKSPEEMVKEFENQ